MLYSDATPSVTNRYDRLGRLTQQATAEYQLNSTYNLAGELLTETYAGGSLAGLGITNGYDQFLRRTNLTARQAGSPLVRQAFGYDQASRLQSVKDGNGNAAGYSYVANSALVGQIAFTNGSVQQMTTTKTYDFLNRLTGIASTPVASPAVNFNYNYNAANQRTRNTLVDGSYWVYQYDVLGQVTSGKKYFADGTFVPGQEFDYSFDDIGNRLQTKTGGDSVGAGCWRTATMARSKRATNDECPMPAGGMVSVADKMIAGRTYCGLASGSAFGCRRLGREPGVERGCNPCRVDKIFWVVTQPLRGNAGLDEGTPLAFFGGALVG